MNTETLVELGIRYGVRVLAVLVAFLIGLWLAGRIGAMVRRSMTRREVDATLAVFAGNATRWLLLILVGLACLGVFGVETTSFAAVLGAAGLAIGLAFQGTLSSVAGGVMLLILRPFRVDDVVTVAGQTGKVVEIGLFATLLDTPDNRRIVLPNSAVFGAAVENVTFHERRRVDLTVGVDYEASLDETREVLRAAAAEVEGAQETVVVLGSLGDSAVNWHVRIWCETGQFFAVLESATSVVKRRLDEAGIGIPYPQMDVHLDGSVARAG